MRSETAGATGPSSPESVELCRIHDISSERWLGPSERALLAGGLVNLGTKVDSTLVEVTVLVCALAVGLLHCLSQSCWAFYSTAYLINVGSRTSVVCSCTYHKPASL